MSQTVIKDLTFVAYLAGFMFGWIGLPYIREKNRRARADGVPENVIQNANYRRVIIGAAIAAVIITAGILLHAIVAVEVIAMNLAIGAFMSLRLLPAIGHKLRGFKKVKKQENGFGLCPHCGRPVSRKFCDCTCNHCGRHLLWKQA